MERFDIQPKEFYVQAILNTPDNGLQYELVPICEKTRCDRCQSSNIIKHGNADRYIRDLSAHGKLVGLHIRGHRYRCKDCGSTFSDSYRSINDRYKMTNRMREYIMQKAFSRPFAHIADELSIHKVTVRDLFLEAAKQKDAQRVLYAPKILGIDENHLGGQYRGILTDISNALIIEILPKRTKPELSAFLKTLPGKEHTECVTFDMWRPYRDIAKQFFPNAVLVVDKFHVVKELNKSLEAIRVQLRSDLTSAERRDLLHSRWTLLSNGEDLSLTQRDQLDEVFYKHPQFELPYRLKEEFRHIYLDAGDKEHAQSLYRDWRNEAVRCAGLEGFVTTIDHWKEEIFNYFDYPATNAVTESLNRLVDEINNQGRGYSFDVLRAKVLYDDRAQSSQEFRFVKGIPPATSQMGWYSSSNKTASLVSEPTAPYEACKSYGAHIMKWLEVLQNERF